MDSLPILLSIVCLLFPSFEILGFPFAILIAGVTSWRTQWSQEAPRGTARGAARGLLRGQETPQAPRKPCQGLQFLHSGMSCSSCMSPGMCSSALPESILGGCWAQAAKNFSREDIEKVLENQGARVPGRMFCSPLVVRWWYEHSHSPGNLRVSIFARVYAVKSFIQRLWIAVAARQFCWILLRLPAQVGQQNLLQVVLLVDDYYQLWHGAVPSARLVLQIR